MMSNEEIDYKLAAEQLRTGKPLFGKDDALAPMLERILNAALESADPLSKASRQHVVWCPEKEKGRIVMMHPLIRVGTMGLEPMTSAM